MPLSPGTRIGAYEVLSLIGQGGMGEVYRAKDTHLKRDVALKILPDAFANDPDRVARFQREAELLATLNHPNIASIYGLEQADGMRALVLELVDGPTLADRIVRGPIPPDEALAIARQIAEALEAAHDRGIIHRDLKPANIKLAPDDKVKVLDFGLAKLLGPEVASTTSSPALLANSPTITTPAMTMAGVILGTAAFMSPEQAKGREADKRSDVWAFGCVVYEMLTGRRAFDGEDVSDTLAAVLRGEPDWTALSTAVPESMRVLLKGCLEKDRHRRIGDMSTAIFVMRQPAILESPGAVRSPIRPPRWRRALPVLTSVVLTTALVSAVWWALRPDVPPRIVTRSMFPLGQGQQFTNTGRLLVGISPDGTQMVYVANYRLYLRAMSELDARAISGTEPQYNESVTNPAFSPDGRFIAFYSSRGQVLKKIAVNGGTAVTLCPAANPFGMSWDASGILYGERDGIMRVSADGGKPERLIALSGDELVYGPEMLPDHETVLFTLAPSGPGIALWDRAKIVVQSLKSGRRTVLIEGGSDARYVRSGHLVYALSGVLYAVPFDVRRLRTSGGPSPIVEGVSRSGLVGAAHFSVANTGSLVYIPGPNSASSSAGRLARLDRQGRAEFLNLVPSAYLAPRVSPDGKWVAVGSDDGKDANIWILDLGGATSGRQLTFKGKNRSPIWAADGQRVMYQTDREGDVAVFWQRADGSGPAERLTTPDPGTTHTPESSSSKNNQLLFSVARGSTRSLWTLDMTSRRAARFDDVESAIPLNGVFSPDGRWVAYTVSEEASVATYVQPFPATGAKYRIWPGAIHPAWSPDGHELFAVESRGFGFVTVTTQPTFAFSSPATQSRVFSEGGPLSARPFDTLPDGQHFLAVMLSNTEQLTASRQIEVVQNWQEELKQRVPVK